MFGFADSGRTDVAFTCLPGYPLDIRRSRLGAAAVEEPSARDRGASPPARGRPAASCSATISAARSRALGGGEQVSAQSEVKKRWKDRSEWVWSAEVVNEPLISPEVFNRAQEVARAGAHRSQKLKRRTTNRRYALSGLVVCGVCGRRMQGSWNHDAAHYRCKFPAEYSLANRIEHPRTVYVREAAILPSLDEWLGSVFAPRNLDKTLEALTAVGAVNDATDARSEAARRKLEDCDARLGKYPAALDAGGDPIVIAEWIREVQGERLAAQRQLARSVPSETLSRAELRSLVRSVRDAVKMLAKADPALKRRSIRGLDCGSSTGPRSDSSPWRFPWTPRVLQRVSEGRLQP
jgi:hypothetical protein